VTAEFKKRGAPAQIELGSAAYRGENESVFRELNQVCIGEGRCLRISLAIWVWRALNCQTTSAKGWLNRNWGRGSLPAVKSTG
jgi:hypothetical protein